MTRIAYVPHPITPARKAKLRAEGYKIIDARFAPAGAEILGEEIEAPKGPKPAGPKPEPITREAIQEMGKRELIETLEAHGHDPDGRLGAEKLRNQLLQVMFVNG